MADPTAAPVLPAQVISERTRLVIPSVPNWIEPTVEYLRQKAILGGACSETRSGKLLIALHEAVTNAVVHGNLGISSALKEESTDAFAQALAQRAADPTFSGREVDIMIDYDGDVCRWIITDQGGGFDVEKVVARCTSDDPEIMLASGRGILMMKSFLDEVRFDLGGRRVVLTLSRGSGKEMRKDVRVPMTTACTVTPVLPDGTPLWSDTCEALSRNFSERGIALLQKQLADATNVLIGVRTEEGIVHIPAEVKHARPLGAAGVELGCQFQTPPAPKDGKDVPASADAARLAEVHAAVITLLDAYAGKQIVPDERRAHQRIAFTERIAVAIDGRPQPIVAFARDLSKGGIAFITEAPLPAHVTIAFGAGDGSTLRVRCQVVRCARIQDGFFDVGATFQQLAPVN